MLSFKKRFLDSNYGRCFHAGSPASRGRAFMLYTGLLTGIILQITTGAFYTGFLLGYNIDLVNIGILSAAPYLASLVGFFCPELFRRFRRKKYIVFVCNLLSYFLNYGLLTAIPLFPVDNSKKIPLMVAVILLANVFSAIAGAGTTAWCTEYLSQDFRSYYFSVSPLIQSMIPILFASLSAVITDMLASMGNSLPFIVSLRYVSLGLGILNALLWLIPEETPESIKKNEKFSDLIGIPLRNRPFMKTAIINFGWFFANSITTAFLTVFLLDQIQMSYTYYMIMYFSYLAFYPLTSSFWRKMIRKYGDITIFGSTVLVHTITRFFVFAFLTPQNYLPVTIVAMLIANLSEPALNISLSSLFYLYLPNENRIYYSAFSQALNNTANFLGTAAGTLFVSLVGDRSITLFGFKLDQLPLLLLFAGSMKLILAIVTTISGIRDHKKKIGSSL